MRHLRSMTSHLSRIHKFIQSQNPKPSHKIPKFNRHFCAAAASAQSKPSDNVIAIANEISGLTVFEIMDLTDLIREKNGVGKMPIMGVVMPEMGFGVSGAGGKGGGGAAAGGADAAAEKAEKMVFDVKLEGFDASAKIKVIKEVRGFTDLGLKDAKDLVEKAPTFLKKGVTKDEAEAIIKKLTEIGAKASME